LITAENKKVSAKWTGRLGDYVEDFASAGINDIADEEFNVTASGGIIEAPEGTEVYALSVMRTGRNSLPAGVYVVRYDGKSQKVIMK
jgi:hypothetical protein